MDIQLNRAAVKAGVQTPGAVGANVSQKVNVGNGPAANVDLGTPAVTLANAKLTSAVTTASLSPKVVLATGEGKPGEEPIVPGAKADASTGA